MVVDERLLSRRVSLAEEEVAVVGSADEAEKNDLCFISEDGKKLGNRMVVEEGVPPTANK